MQVHNSYIQAVEDCMLEVSVTSCTGCIIRLYSATSCTYRLYMYLYIDMLVK